MALSPNFGFPEPDNSSLVKNGAQDIRALGDSIDTFLNGSPTRSAGKNKVINGDFGIWQRGTSFNTADVYTADRWVMSLSGATATTSRQSFTVGQSDVPNNPTYFLRYAASIGDNNARIMYRGEDVTTFANTATTVSFYAKGTNPAGGSLALLLTQYFGAAGSAAVDTTIGSITLTASWQRFTFTFTPPSVSGKTITTGNYFALDFRQPTGDTGTAAWTLDLANVQWEYGSKATPFQTATGTIQGELAACQRYYVRYGGDTAYTPVANGGNISTTAASVNVAVPVQMRVVPTAVDFSTMAVWVYGGSIVAATNITIAGESGNKNVRLNVTTGSGLTATQPVSLTTNNSTSGYVGLSAEL